MSSIPSNSIVLVTGVNGFIGSHIADQFLTAGYNVRGTARSPSKADAVKRWLTKRHGDGRLEIAVVPNISTNGAFDDAVKGAS